MFTCIYLAMVSLFITDVACLFLLVCVGHYAFHCAAERKCIPEVWRCDGIYDCSGDLNSEDELECEGCTVFTVRHLVKKRVMCQNSYCEMTYNNKIHFLKT